MTEFVASNGWKIRLTEKSGAAMIDVYGDMGGATFSTTGEKLTALREFFQHERDIELGRWRPKEHPEYVVYLHDDDRVRVVRESDGVSYSWNRLSVTLPYGQGCAEIQFQPVAREFFAAHPEPKPWHNAKDGEVWVLSFNADCGFRNGDAWYSNSTEFVLLHDSGRIEHNEYRITAGRRIWPEAKDAD